MSRVRQLIAHLGLDKKNISKLVAIIPFLRGALCDRGAGGEAPSHVVRPFAVAQRASQTAFWGCRETWENAPADGTDGLNGPAATTVGGCSLMFSWSSEALDILAIGITSDVAHAARPQTAANGT